jgi:hypothetical protein
MIFIEINYFQLFFSFYIHTNIWKDNYVYAGLSVRNCSLSVYFGGWFKFEQHAVTIVNLIKSLSSKVRMICFWRIEMFQNALYQKSYADGFCWGIRVSYEQSCIFNISLIHTACKTPVTFWHSVSSSKNLKLQQLKLENPLASGGFAPWTPTRAPPWTRWGAYGAPDPLPTLNTLYKFLATPLSTVAKTLPIYMLFIVIVY